MSSSTTRIALSTALNSPLNESTRAYVGRPRALPQLTAAELDVQWQHTLKRVIAWRAEHPEGDALAVVVRAGARFDVSLKQVDGRADDAREPHPSLTRREPAALVIGRHSNADLVLDEHGPASLRHAAVVLWPSSSSSSSSSSEGGRAARAVAVDLRSEGGLALRDGRVARRLATTTALRFGAGAAEVTVLVASNDAPFAIRFADQLEAHLAGALVDVEDRISSGVSPVSWSAAAPSRAASLSSASSASWERSLVVRTRVNGAPHAPIAEETVAVRASRADVERGVILGRDHRCDRTTALADDNNVSRVHALVFAADGQLWVLDTASTGGTDLVGPAGTVELGEGRRIARLQPHARLYLAGTEALLVVD